jgi:uncharacterized protein YecE (DUF72 family)
MSVSAEMREDIERFRFRNLHERILIGTASDRYAGWLGQIYSPGSYEGQISFRKKSVAGQSFDERTLPVRSVSEYFEHFPFLEIDYTFYQPLLDRDLQPASSFHVLSSYAGYLKPGDGIILKVPQAVSARRIRAGKEFIPNPDYLNPVLFTRQFYEPAGNILGDAIKGFIFEQEYHGKNERLPSDENAARLSEFFSAIPADSRYHLELRTPSYLTPSCFDVLSHHGVGQVLSHWTWLPRLRDQFSKSGGRFFNSGGDEVIRLMTPLHMSYDDSYVKAYPFDRMVEGMMSSSMLDDTVEIMEKALIAATRVYITINNRAGGNAPFIAQLLADNFLKRHSRIS